MERTVEVLMFGVLLGTAGCRPDPVPRPPGYFRIDLPVQEYTTWAPACPFTAELPVYARPVPAVEAPSPCWTDIRFPGQRAHVYLTYKPVQGDLPKLIGDAHGFKNKHQVKATRIRSERVVHGSARVYGTFFEVDGDAASPLVFYLTDSASHFVYGSLYFDVRPNADSLAPVTDRLRADMRHFAQALRWR